VARHDAAALIHAPKRFLAPSSRQSKPEKRRIAMTTNTDTAKGSSEPEAIATEGGVDLLLPLSTPRDILDIFVASCKVGQCDCDTTFVSKITGVDLFEEPGHLRVRIDGTVTPDEVLAEMVASAPELRPGQP